MHDKVLFTPYTPTRAFDEVAGRIKEVILDRQLIPGDRLPSERSLAQQFQVGRLTIREALRTLETKGLIEIKKGSGGGAFVASHNLGAVTSIIKDNLLLEGLTSDQITEARIALECAAAESAARHATEEDLERIALCIEESEVIMADVERGREIVMKMIQFHSLIAEASHNLPFIMFIRALLEWARVRPILSAWIPSEQDKQYARTSFSRIFQAISERNPDAARDSVREHVEKMRALLVDPKEDKKRRAHAINMSS